MGGYERKPIDIGDVFHEYPTESRSILGSLAGYLIVFELIGADWFLEQALRCGFWNGPEYCGGSEWWLLLYTFILGCVMTPGIIGGVSLGQKLSFTQMTIPERDGLAGILSGGLFGSLSWAVLWMWSLPHTWGMMPFEHAWGFIFLWGFLLLPMGVMPIIGILIDASNRIKNAGQQLVEAMEFGQRNLASGTKGDDVRTLQELLNKAGHSLSVDGSFGNQTHSAVKKFQTENGLAVDGIVGPITSEALTELMVTSTESDNTPSLTLSQEDFGSHEAIEVAFKNGPGNPLDWIGIYQSKSPIDEHNHHGNWLYVNGEKTPTEGLREGEIAIAHNLQAGDYKVAFLANNGYHLLATVDFVISHDHRSLKEDSASTSEKLEAEVTEIEESKEQEITALAEAVEEISTDPNFDGEISNLRMLAEEEMEGQIKNLPAPIQNKIRAGFAAKMDTVEKKARSKIPDAAKVAAGVGVAAGAVGAAAGLATIAGVSQRAEVIMEDGEVNLDEIQDQVRDLVEGMDIGEPEFDDDVEEMESTEDTVEEVSEPVEEALPEDTPEPAIEPMNDGRGNEFILLAQQVRDSLTSTQRRKIVSEDLTGEWPVSVVINRVSRTTGIGLTDEYKKGKTIEGKIEGTDIDVSIIASALKHTDLDELEEGMIISANCVVNEYRAVLKRLELLG